MKEPCRGTSMTRNIDVTNEFTATELLKRKA